MNVLKNIIGIALVLLAWFDPLGWSMFVSIALFILGFDMIGIYFKVGIFAVNFFFPVFGEAFGYLSWTLLMLVLPELMLIAIGIYRPYNFVVKPTAVFAVAFLALGLQPALVVAGTDLVINMTDKFKSKKRK